MHSKECQDTIFFLHRKSNHIFTIWQHLSLLTIIREYDGKSYRMFTEWLVGRSSLSQDVPSHPKSGVLLSYIQSVFDR
jgi:hypothetical protein